MLIVKKFGGTSVADKERIFNVAKRCIRDYQNGNDVVVVLSAMGKYTDELIAKAKEINPNPSKREMDMLFTIGEQMSVSLMAMAMDALGVRAISLNAFQVAMHTTSNYSNARLKKIDTERIRRELDDRKIVIVTGFQGINKYNDYTTLGRGGSDTTAVALAAALHADACEIYTDVDGVYTAEFATDSSMFHVNEANDKKGELTVKDGKMTIHVSLVSKKIVNLFAGTAEDAQKDGAEIIEPTTDTVKYSDGYTEEVYGFDIPVPAIDEEFDVAILGEKGKWYDHKVSIKNPVKDDAATEKADDSDKKSDGKKLEDLKLEDGTYETEVTLTGGTGKATVESPAKVEIKDKEATATIIWSSPNYDYMKIGDETYYPVNDDGNSVFEIPVSVFNEAMEVVADTTAMGNPHEISYTLTFDLDSAEKE